MPRKLKPYKVDTIYVPPLNVRVDIMLDRERKKFFAEYYGEAEIVRDQEVVAEVMQTVGDVYGGKKSTAVACNPPLLRDRVRFLVAKRRDKEMEDLREDKRKAEVLFFDMRRELGELKTQLADAQKAGTMHAGRAKEFERDAEQWRKQANMNREKIHEYERDLGKLRAAFGQLTIDKVLKEPK